MVHGSLDIIKSMIIPRARRIGRISSKFSKPLFRNKIKKHQNEIYINKKNLKIYQQENEFLVNISDLVGSKDAKSKQVKSCNFMCPLLFPKSLSNSFLSTCKAVT